MKGRLQNLFNRIRFDKLALIFIILFALAVRVYGLNWDSNQHLHPDERFLTMVATAVRLPDTFADYLDPSISPLNPYNHDGFGFFVYGTFPLTITKYFAVQYNMDSYDGIVLMGRLISAMFDVGTLLMVYLLAQFFERKYHLHKLLKLFAAGMYAVAVLPIQHAHFFTTDAAATFFSMTAVYGALRYSETRSIRFVFLSAVFTGLGLGTKLSSVFVMPLTGIFFLMSLAPYFSGKVKLTSELRQAVLRLVLSGIIFGIVAYISLRLADPRIFAHAHFLDVSLSPQFISNIQELKTLTSPDALFPPSIQWVSKKALLFPLRNMMFFGVGFAYFIASIIGIAIAIKKKYSEALLIILWMVAFFIYQGIQFVMTMRYFYMLYPFLALFGGLALVALYSANLRPEMKKGLMFGTIVSILIWPMSFMTIYTRPHTYVQASEWIYENVPANAVLLQEHWNDFLPLNLVDKEAKTVRLASQYQVVEAAVFDIDTADKMLTLDQKLADADYYVFSNNRGYGSIPYVPERYPAMKEFYEDLMNGDAGYEIVQDVTSYPTINLLFTDIEINDQWAEEAFTVYDHPRVLILKNVRK